VLARLARRFRVFAFDARGQGASEKPDGEPSHEFAMDRLAEDLRYIVAAVRERIGPDCPLHYASHSMGGNAALLLEGRFGEAPFETLTLFEPPIHPPKGHAAYDPAWTSSPILAKWSSRRRDRFPDRETLRQEAQKIVTFGRFTPEMMDAYVAAAAYETDDDDLRLFCPGRVEAAFYTHCPPAGVFDAAGRVKTPTWMYSSDPAAVDAGHVWAPPVIRDVAATMDNAEYRIMPGCRHLMVQEDPEGCVAQVIAHIDGAG
jgi:pimeloyl-ACP methyl ester carboxylesterase